MSLNAGMFRKVHRRHRYIKTQPGEPKRRQCRICKFWNYLPESAVTGVSEVEILTDDDGDLYPGVKDGLGCRFCGSGNWW